MTTPSPHRCLLTRVVKRGLATSTAKMARQMNRPVARYQPEAREIRFNSKFLFRHTEILRDKPPIGKGAYGEVLFARCDSLLCAAKCVHKILYEAYLHDPAHQQSDAIEGFLKEYQYLSSMSHPNIVQYLGYHEDPQTNVPYLLMELMDESLTHYLESLTGPVPFHKSLDFTHDIAKGLEYLHCNDIMHCDLSSNNVLLLAKYRAKITDFGQSFLATAEADYHIRGKLVPGTLVYMPPEATRQDDPGFSSYLDVFSLGVLMIQIVTRKWPTPTEATTILEGAGPGSTGQVIRVPEIDRRRSHLGMITERHPLRQLAINCIADNEEDRPLVSEVCDRLSELKEVLPEYIESQRDNPIDPVNPTLPTSDVVQDRTVKEMERQIEQLQKMVATMDSEAIQMRFIMEKKDALLEQAGIRGPSTIPTSQPPTNRPSPSSSLNRSLTQSSRNTSSPSSSLTSSSSTSSAIPIQDLVVANKSFKWYPLSKTPSPLYGGSSITIGNRAYVTGQASKVIYEFNPDANSWATLPTAPTASFAIVSVNGILTIIGGYNEQGYSNALFSLVKAQGGGPLSWQQSYPPMKDARVSPGAASNGQYVVVVGGDQQVPGNRIISNAVEILDIKSQNWTIGDRIPRVVKRCTLTISGDRVYMLGGITNDNQPLPELFYTSLNQLITESAQRSLTGDLNRAFKMGKCWQKMSCPVVYGTCTVLKGYLVLIGGWGNKPSNAVYVFDPVSQPSNPWRYVGPLPLARMDAMCAVLPGDRLMVVGGRTQSKQEPVLNAAELACPV